MIRVSAEPVAVKRFEQKVHTSPWHAAFPALLFILLASAFIVYAGIQTDEALFGGPLCRSWQFYSIRIGRYDLPVMNMPYIGTLKTLLYAPILLHARRPAAALIRWPVIVIGAITLLFLWGFLLSVHGRRAAWVASILLATDTSFLLTTTFDWGPVALQHLLLVAALFFAVRWFHSNSSASLAAAGFCCGLAFWDKAEFIWIFTGVAAGLFLFATSIVRRLTWPRVALFSGALLLGALPLIIYNFAGDPKFGTLHANPQIGSDLKPADFVKKLGALHSTLDGSALFGYLVNEDWSPQPKPARTRLQRASFAVRRITGEHRRNALLPAFYAALLLLPLLWRTRARKAMCFSLVAMAVAWLFMAATGGGGAAHHAVLLWPLPHIFMGVAFAEASLRVRFGKPALIAAVAFLAAANLLVTNQYLYQFIRNGPTTVWSNGIYAVANRLKQSTASQVVLPDWGMADSLCLLTHDRPPARLVDDTFLSDAKPPVERQDDLRVLSDPQAVWLEHVPGDEASPGIDGKILSAAHLAGFDPVMIETYSDNNGRPIFQTLRFIPHNR
jgi:hypothetical protein